MENSRYTTTAIQEKLQKYERSGHFSFRDDDKLGQVCNAPKDSGGVYLIFAQSNLGSELIYIGRSGEILSDGTEKLRKDGLGGRFTSGKQFGGSRSKTWPRKMAEESIDVLDIYWYVTLNSQVKDCPDKIEKGLRRFYEEKLQRRPRWNKN